MRGTAGGQAVTYVGELTDVAMLGALTPFRLAGGDQLPPDFRMSVGDVGWDGFDFTLPPGNTVCFDLASPLSATIEAGADRVPLGPRFGLPGFGACPGDSPYTLSVMPVSVAEDAGSALVTVVVSPAPTVALTVDYRSVDGSALNGSDYGATSGSLVFAIGETEQTVPVTIIDDNDAEGTEDFSIVVTGAQAGSATGTVTIASNDGGQVSIPSCGEPAFDRTTETGIFIWNDCGTDDWHVRGTAGGQVVTYVGELSDVAMLSALTPFRLAGDDQLPPDFRMAVGGTGWDGFDFTLPPGNAVCFDLASPASAMIEAGANRVSLGPRFGLPGFGPCDGVTPPPADPLNVLLISIDDLAPVLGPYGVSEVQTPAIDRLAAGGVTFTRAYGQIATSSPARTSLMTGLRPDVSGVLDLRTHFRDTVPTVVTLPQYFKAHGYRTQGIGKVYFSPELDDDLSWTEPTIYQWGPPKPLGPDGRKLAYAAMDLPDEDFADQKVATEAISALRNLGDDPFFLAVGFIKPHLPFVVPRRFFDLYDPWAIPMAVNPFKAIGAPDFAFEDAGELRTYSEVPPVAQMTESFQRELKRAYYASISFVDEQVGRLLDELDASGLADETIVVLWSDHGYHLGEQADWGKHTIFDVGVRVPLIISTPGRTANRLSDAVVELLDLHPTLIELAGLPLPGAGDRGGYALQGDSLVAFIDDPAVEARRGAFSQWRRDGNDGYSIRTDAYRFSRWVNQFNGATVLELYDHYIDPNETNNLADDPQYAPVIDALGAALDAGGEVDLPPSLH